MPRLDATKAADKLIRNLSSATQSITDGVNAVTESPMEKAANNSAAYVEGVRKAVEDGKWQAGLRRVSLPQWKEAFITKGVPRIAQGIQAARPKIISFYNEFFPFLEGVQQKVNSMPNVTLEDSINRMVTNCREIAKFSRK